MKVPVHVLHVITGLESGGAERSLFNLLTSRVDADWHHSVVSLSGLGHYGAILQREGIDVCALNMRNIFEVTQLPKRLTEAITRSKIDIVQGWMPHGNVMASIIASVIRCRVRLAWNIRQSLYDPGDEKFLTRGLIRGLKTISRQPDVIIYNSHQAREHHEALGFSQDRAVVIPNGFDVEHWRPDQMRRVNTRTTLGVGEDAIILGFVGRFDPLKNIPGFMLACAKAMEIEPALHVVLAGKGLTTSNPALAPLFAMLPSGRVHALGRRADIEEVMPAFDFFCLSSVSEAFPNVIGEAMASGLPCIATDVGDCARLVADTGRIVPRGDVEALALAIADMVRLGDAERTKLGMAARQRIAESFSLAATTEAYVELYYSMAGREI